MPTEMNEETTTQEAPEVETPVVPNPHAAPAQVEAANTDQNNTLITTSVNFGVQMRAMTTTDGLAVSEEIAKAVVRVNPDQSEQVIATVGKRYELVDHRTCIRDFAEQLTTAGYNTTVTHKVFRSGARIYSNFNINTPLVVQGPNNTQKSANPFLTLTTSHDGSLKVGFMVGAVVDGLRIYGRKHMSLTAKHLSGTRLDQVMGQISQALEAFQSEVIPLWSRATLTAVSNDRAEDILKRAVKKNVISQRRIDSWGEGHTFNTYWDMYKKIVETVSVESKTGNEEGSINRNRDANDFFLKELARI
jgi:hypothetical protein